MENKQIKLEMLVGYCVVPYLSFKRLGYIITTLLLTDYISLNIFFKLSILQQWNHNYKLKLNPDVFISLENEKVVL